MKTGKLHSTICLLVVIHSAYAVLEKCTAADFVRKQQPSNVDLVAIGCARSCNGKQRCGRKYCKCEERKEFCYSVPSLAKNGSIQVYEDASPGTSVLKIPVDGSEVWSYSIQRSDSVDGTTLKLLEEYLKLSPIGSNYELIVHKTLDLEQLQEDYGIRLSELRIKLTCKNKNGVDSGEIKLIVLPVNEFAPNFLLLPVVIREDTAIDTEVIELINYVYDGDVNPTSNELGPFGISPYNQKGLDGRAYFKMDNLRTGSIRLTKTLDFESLASSNSTSFSLNVSASDIHGKTTYTSLNITVLDVDDLPPEFYHRGCPVRLIKTSPCVVRYEASVPTHFTGKIGVISPASIKARDMDSLNYSIHYSLEQPFDESLENFQVFAIDNLTADVYVTKAFQGSGKIHLLVVATEKSSEARKTKASLKVTIIDKNKMTKPLIKPEKSGNKDVNSILPNATAVMEASTKGMVVHQAGSNKLSSVKDKTSGADNSNSQIEGGSKGKTQETKQQKNKISTQNEEYKTKKKPYFNLEEIKARIARVEAEKYKNKNVLSRSVFIAVAAGLGLIILILALVVTILSVMLKRDIQKRHVFPVNPSGDPTIYQYSNQSPKPVRAISMEYASDRFPRHSNSGTSFHNRQNPSNLLPTGADTADYPDRPIRSPKWVDEMDKMENTEVENRDMPRKELLPSSETDINHNRYIRSQRLIRNCDRSMSMSSARDFRPKQRSLKHKSHSNSSMSFRSPSHRRVSNASIQTLQPIALQSRRHRPPTETNVYNDRLMRQTLPDIGYHLQESISPTKTYNVVATTDEEENTSPLPRYPSSDYSENERKHYRDTHSPRTAPNTADSRRKTRENSSNVLSYEPMEKFGLSSSENLDMGRRRITEGQFHTPEHRDGVRSLPNTVSLEDKRHYSASKRNKLKPRNIFENEIVNLSQSTTDIPNRSNSTIEGLQTTQLTRSFTERRPSTSSVATNNRSLKRRELVNYYKRKELQYHPKNRRSSYENKHNIEKFEHENREK